MGTTLHPYMAKVNPSSDVPIALVVVGPAKLLLDIAEKLKVGEPAALSKTACPESPEQKFMRVTRVTSKLRAAQVEVACDFYVHGDLPVDNEGSIDSFRCFPGLFDHLSPAPRSELDSPPSTSNSRSRLRPVSSAKSGQKINSSPKMDVIT